MKGIAASRNTTGDLVIKISPDFKEKIVKALKEKFGPSLPALTDEDILDYVVNETHTIKSLPETKK